MEDTKTIKINGLEFNADDLRDISDVMDNPKLLPNECKTIKEFVERVELK